MTGGNNADGAAKVPPGSEAPMDRRRFRRVALAITGRVYVPETQDEALCTTTDISAGGVAIQCELKHEPRGRAVLYLDGFGRFEGPISRETSGGFAMTFDCSQQKRDKLADQLTMAVNRHLLNEADLRRHDRVEAASGSFTHFTRSTGEQIRCEVLDLSLTGVSLRTDTRPPVGEHLLIGHRAGRVARHHEQGIGIEFFGVMMPPTTVVEKVAPAVAPAPLRPLRMQASGRN